MDELKKEYSILFNGITDTITELERTISHLKALQQKAEEACMAGIDTVIELPSENVTNDDL